MARTGRPPKPTAAHRARGTYREDRHGNRVVEAEEGIPKPPARLTADERKCWHELVEQLRHVPGLLTLADATALEGAAKACARAVHAGKTLKRLAAKADGFYIAGSHGLRLHPAVQHEKEAWKEVRSWLAVFGLNPQARASIRVPEGGDDPFAKLLGELAAAAADLRGEAPAAAKAKGGKRGASRS